MTLPISSLVVAQEKNATEKAPPPFFFLLLNFLAVTSVLLKTQKCGFYACAVVIYYDSVREIVGVGATGSPRLGSVS